MWTKISLCTFDFAYEQPSFSTNGIEYNVFNVFIGFISYVAYSLDVNYYICNPEASFVKVILQYMLLNASLGGPCPHSCVFVCLCIHFYAFSPSVHTKMLSVFCETASM